MTVDTTYHVAAELAEFDVPTLMTKAFEITHRLDAISQYNGTPQGARAISEARAERDAIVREMQRRSDGFDRALATIEAIERIAVRVIGNHFEQPDEPGDALDAGEAARLLHEAATRASDTTCSLAKNQTVSDRISRAARDIVRSVVAR